MAEARQPLEVGYEPVSLYSEDEEEPNESDGNVATPPPTTFHPAGHETLPVPVTVRVVEKYRMAACAAPGASARPTASPTVAATSPPPGVTLVIWRLDRLGRSMKHLLELIEDLETRSISLVSLNEQIDTTSANGRLILRLLASLAAFSVIWTPPARPDLAVAAA